MVTVNGLADSPIPPRPCASTARTSASATMIETACSPAKSTSTRSPAARRPPTARAGSMGMLMARSPPRAARGRSTRLATISPSPRVTPAMRPVTDSRSRARTTVARSGALMLTASLRKSSAVTRSPARISWAATATPRRAVVLAERGEGQDDADQPRDDHDHVSPGDATHETSTAGCPPAGSPPADRRAGDGRGGRGRGGRAVGIGRTGEVGRGGHAGNPRYEEGEMSGLRRPGGVCTIREYRSSGSFRTAARRVRV